MKHIIYQITNLLNDMIYIGKHSTITPYDMKYYWGSSDWLKSSIEIHGKKNFKRETLFVFETENEAYAKEEEIVTPEFVARENTYNLVVGGKGFDSGENNHMFGKTGENHPMFGKHHTEETCRKISESLKGKHHTEETRKKMSESHSGENHFMFGKHHTEKSKRKMSEAKIGVCVGENHPLFGKRGKDSYWYGKHHTEESKKKMSENSPNKLLPEIIEQRRKDVEKIPKVWGYKAELGRWWNLDRASAGQFIKKYALDLVEI